MNRKGFTIIELMIVVAIIGILAAIVLPQFAAHRARPVVEKILNNDEKLTPEEQTFYEEHKKLVDGLVTEKRNDIQGGTQKATKDKRLPVDSTTASSPTTPVSSAKTTQAVATVAADTQKPAVIDPKKPIPPIPPVPNY